MTLEELMTGKARAPPIATYGVWRADETKVNWYFPDTLVKFYQHFVELDERIDKVVSVRKGPAGTTYADGQLDDYGGRISSVRVVDDRLEEHQDVPRCHSATGAVCRVHI
jgi:hypothetical protein